MNNNSGNRVFVCGKGKRDKEKSGFKKPFLLCFYNTGNELSFFLLGRTRKNSDLTIFNLSLEDIEPCLHLFINHECNSLTGSNSQ